MGGRKPVGPRGLCAYLVEIQECDGKTSVPGEASFLIKKCILDKIYSMNQDQIAICRSDTTSRINFVPVTWEALEKGLHDLSEIRSCKEGGGIENPISSLDDIVNAVIEGAQEDTYDEKKILYFSNLSSYVLDEKEVTKLAVKLCENDVFISIILPRKVDMSEVQIQNAKLLKSVFKRDEYESIALVLHMDKARRQILNTQSKKPVRPSPWNVRFEVTPEILINVGGYSSTRKNKSSDLNIKRAVLKDEGSTNAAESSTANSNGNASMRTDVKNSLSNQSEQGTAANKKTVVVEPAKDVVEKEHVWTENDGTVVDKDDIGKAYYFGDKLVPYNELENEGSYRSGGTCLKLLAFCPKDKIAPAFHVGDGITLFYPRKDDVESEVKFKALLKAMLNTDRIAIVRRVYRKDTRVQIGVLAPEEERQCLIFTEICFADDVSVPRFPVLIKPEENDEEETNLEISEKDALIDELIRNKSLDNFHPSDGPTDPSVKAFWEMITKKVFPDTEYDKQTRKLDNIDIYFESLFVDDLAALSEKISNLFPLKENKLENERLAGKNVFRKRMGDNMKEEEVEKRLKMEGIVDKEDEKIDVDENPDDLDNLLDEL